jgi:hypothetical protein
MKMKCFIKCYEKEKRREEREVECIDEEEMKQPQKTIFPFAWNGSKQHHIPLLRIYVVAA